MSREIKSIENLLYKTKSISEHQEEIKKLKGESFNVFSILKMETQENATHSAFLGELLNPQGSHLQRNLFLNLFLQTVGHKSFDLTSARVTLEKSIGTRNDNLKMGGRIDIHIADANKNTISIENKIYAIDQEAQIERYVNYNREKNTVYYLTLNGNAPSAQSQGSLRDGEDYFSISYRDTIVQWLERCLKESAEQPILRESIKQYIILIKKLTNELTDAKMKNDIQDLIAQNYQYAKKIESSVWSVELKAATDFLNDVRVQVQEALKEGWTITVDDDLSQAMTGARIAYKDWNGIYLKVEGGSKVPWAISWYGIVAPEKEYDRSNVLDRLAKTNFIKEGYRKSPGWPCYKELLSFATTEQRSRLFQSDQRTELIQEISELLIQLAQECRGPLSNIEKLG